MRVSCISHFVVLLCCGSVLSELDRFMNFQRQGEAPVDVGDRPLPPDQWLVQKLDHFDTTNPGSWWQRYQSNGFKADKDSPIFLMIGGANEVSPSWLVRGAWLEYAKKFNALCFQLEHRFYGRSQPTEDLSVENLRYLSSEQALADIAYFIHHINSKYRLGPKNKWVVFGGNYAGSLAAWSRLKYPHLIHAAVSSSAPLLAATEFRGYYKALFESFGESCSTNIQKAVEELGDLLDDTPDTNKLSKIFNLCEPLDITKKDDVTLLLLSIADQFNEVLLRGSNGNAEDSVPGALNDICYRMNDDKAVKLKKLGEMFAKLDSTCFEVSNDEYVDLMKNISFEATDGARAWIYQICTEFGNFGTVKSDDTFGNFLNLQFFVNQCQSIYGSEFNRRRLLEGVRKTNLMYGQKKIATSRVVFVHGSLDPWRHRGITESKNPELPALLIEGTTQRSDMYPSTPDDPQQLVAARRMIAEQLDKWIHSE